MNRKRLALSAAIIGAIAYPVWTGSWMAWWNARKDIEYAGWTTWSRQEDEQAAARLGVSVAQLRADETRKCQESNASPQPRRSTIGRCHMPLSPNEGLASLDL